MTGAGPALTIFASGRGVERAPPALRIFCSDKTAGAEMKVPTSCGESYRLLVKYYGTEDLGEMSRASGISRSTLAYWRSCPKARLRKNGRAHLQRILSESAELKGLAASSKDHGVAALIEMFQEVRDLLVRIEQKMIDRFS